MDLARYRNRVNSDGSKGRSGILPKKVDDEWEKCAIMDVSTEYGGIKWQTEKENAEKNKAA